MKKRKKKIPRSMGTLTLKVTDPIFRQEIHVLLNHTQESYACFLKKHKVEDSDRNQPIARFAGFTTSWDADDGPRNYLILIRRFQWSIFHQGTLIHEITHVVMRIFESNNIPFNQDTQEFIAHAVARIYEDVAHELLVVGK